MGRSDPLKLLVAVGGIYVCYISYSLYQEEIYKYRGPKGERFTSTLFLLLVQCSVNFLFALFGSLILGGSAKLPWHSVMFTAASYIGAMTCSNEALKHVSFPTQALAKSCKMIPVMLMGIFIRGKRYTLQEYLCVGLITLGISLFQLGSKKNKVEKENSLYGMALLFLSLVLDGVTGPSQEVVIQNYKPTTHQLMMHTNGWAIIYLLIGCVVTGQLQTGLSFLLDHPLILQSVIVFSLTSAAGQNFIFFTIKNFNALVCTTITTTRKCVTVILSVVFFGHYLVQQQWLGVLLVNIGLAWELKSKYDKHNARLKEHALKKDQTELGDVGLPEGQMKANGVTAASATSNGRRKSKTRRAE